MYRDNLDGAEQRLLSGNQQKSRPLPTVPLGKSTRQYDTGLHDLKYVLARSHGFVDVCASFTDMKFGESIAARAIRRSCDIMRRPPRGGSTLGTTQVPVTVTEQICTHNGMENCGMGEIWVLGMEMHRG